MFSGILTSLERHVCSVSKEWDGKEDELRLMCQEGDVVCPDCREPLIYRNGVVNRPHFSHRAKSNCELSVKPVSVLNAQSKLFRLFEAVFDTDSVKLDVKVEGVKRRIDVLVKVDNSNLVCYYVFDRSIRRRSGLFDGASELGAKCQIIHIGSIRSEHGESLKLERAQQDFMRRSRYDSKSIPHHGHLHFFDSDSEVLHIYRNFVFGGHVNCYRALDVYEVNFEDVAVDRETGELLSPEDTTDPDERIDSKIQFQYEMHMKRLKHRRSR